MFFMFFECTESTLVLKMRFSAVFESKFVMLIIHWKSGDEICKFYMA